MPRSRLQIAMLIILLSAIVISAIEATFFIYSDLDRFVHKCIEGKIHRLANQAAPATSQNVPGEEASKGCVRDIAGTVGGVIGTLYGPLLVIILSVIFMRSSLSSDALDRSQAYIALSVFVLLQVVSILIIAFAVTQTPDLTDLRIDALQNAVLTSLQGIVVAFAFPRNQDTTPPPGG